MNVTCNSDCVSIDEFIFINGKAMKTFLIDIFWVGLGGFVGSIARYSMGAFIGLFVSGHFPIGTLLINMLGSLIFGFVSELSLIGIDVKPELRLLLLSGFCGAFTTFSTFIHENHQLIKFSEMPTAMLYTISSIVLGFLALLLGIWLAKTFCG